MWNGTDATGPERCLSQISQIPVDFKIVERFLQPKNGKSHGVQVYCPQGYRRIACSGGLDFNQSTKRFQDLGSEEDHGFMGAAPIENEGCHAFADLTGDNEKTGVWVWVYCFKI